MKPSLRPHFAIFVALSCLLAVGLSAQVPQLLNYQGRVAVAGINFDGTGSFKFALVDATGSTTFWSNDGSSIAGSEPFSAVPLTVTKGLYSVLLGDAGPPAMFPINSSVFSNPDVRLRVWFNDGANGSQLLAPDQRIAAVGYAMMAADVPDGAITANKLAAGAAAENLNSAGQSGVAGGGLILSTTDGNTSLTSAGYVRLGATTTSDAWVQRSYSPTLFPRANHSAVWTGNEMIIWGGRDGEDFFNDGARFNAAANSWTSITASSAPSAREEHTAVWTGTEMLIWGGYDGGYVGTGARYNPASDTWSSMTSYLPARRGHTAVWTGAEMIIWGGIGGSGYFNLGGRYNPLTDTWSSTSAFGEPVPRAYHSAIWNGTHMVVWGGFNGTYLTTGGGFSPSAGFWSLAVTNTNAPAGRRDHTAVWTGSEMIVWGGYSGFYQNNGGRYQPGSNSWTLIPNSLTNTPSPRDNHTAIWTGTEMVVWGGVGTAFFNNGGRYFPAENVWKTLTDTGAPGGRYLHTAVWTGNEMIVWGGSNGNRLHDNHAYSPGRVLYLYQRP